ncbi:MAG: HAD-IA family hydrolase [Clostridia bacterium]|nr:HAD-IA family hydrolase [Clostridia bacterium]
MIYDTVIFDLDGTLLDTLGDLHLAVSYALKLNGLPERTLEEVRAFVGNGILNLIKRAVPAGSSSEVVERVFADFKQYYKEHSMDNTAPYPGINKLVSDLKAEGIKLGVVSNKAHFAVTEIIEHYFSGMFDISLGERDGVRKKPAPDAVLEAVRVLGGKHILYIGDSEVDVETARNAGVDSVMVTWGFRTSEELEAAGATDFADDTDCLYRIVKEGIYAYPAE